MSTLSKLLEGKYLYHPDGYVYSTKRTNLDRVANNQMPLVIKSKNASGVYGAQIGTKFYPLAQIVYTLVHGPIPANSIVIANTFSDIPYRVKAEWLTLNTQQPKDPLTATEADVLDMLHSLYKVVDDDVYRSRTLVNGEQSVHPIRGLNGGVELSVRIGSTLVTKTTLHKVLTTNSLSPILNHKAQASIDSCIDELRARAEPVETDDGSIAHVISGTEYDLDTLIDFVTKTANTELVTRAISSFKPELSFVDRHSENGERKHALIEAHNTGVLLAREELDVYLADDEAIVAQSARARVKLQRLAIALTALTRR